MGLTAGMPSVAVESFGFHSNDSIVVRSSPTKTAAISAMSQALVAQRTVKPASANGAIRNVISCAPQVEQPQRCRSVHRGPALRNRHHWQLAGSFAVQV